MDHSVWSIPDNSTEVTEDVNVDSFADNSTSASAPTTSSSAARQMVSPEIAATVGIVVGSIGICANVVVLTVLFRARRQFGSSVHTLIVNQSAMDLFALVFAMCSYIMLITHRYRYNGNQILDGAICVLIQGGALTVTGMTAEKLGLVVITLERYFKIVHAIAHRKYYRDWMTKVGVALPWIGAICLILFPGMGTTRIVSGRCRRMYAWPNKAMTLAFGAFRFIFQYAIEVVIFAYCYGRIFHTIRRQSKVVTGHAGRSQDVPMATTSRDQPQQQGTGAGATTGAKLSRTELNVLQTMIAVIICFMICWTVPAIANLLQLLQIPSLDYNTFMLFGSLGYISFCVNPFIYASRYEVFRRHLKQMMNKGVVVPSGSGGTEATKTTRATRAQGV